MAVRYIADLHLYDVSSLDWRTAYQTLDGYASTLVTKWNECTDPGDLVFIVGDIGHCCKLTIDTLTKLNGIKILVKGNHDVEWGNKLYTCGVFAGIHTIVDSNGIHIQHIPGIYQGTVFPYFVHGHHHRYDVPNMRLELRKYAADTHRLNAAADLNYHHPCTLQELILNKEVLLDKYREMNLLED